MANANNTSLPNETWKPVVGYEGLYEVSDHGRVRSLTRKIKCKDGRTQTRKGRVLKANKANNTDHLFVHLCKDLEGKRSRSVHSLVAEAFLGERPEGLNVCHWDDVPTNNHVSNLRWGTHSDNQQDRIRNGLHHESNKTHCPQGHPYTPENTRIIPSRPNARYCKACQKEHLRKHREKNRK